MAQVSTDSFRDYLKTRRPPRDPFIKKCLADARMLISAGMFPDIQSWDELAMHAWVLRAGPEGMEAARRCWRGFVRLRRGRERASRTA